MDVRLAVAYFLQVDPAQDVTSFCAEQGISRQTYYRLRRRFLAEGLEGLVPRSTRPRSSPSQTTEVVAGVLLAKRAELIGQGWDAGAVSIRSWLLTEGVEQVPSVSTIHRVLRRAGVVLDQPKKRPKGSFRRFAATAANERWQMDGMKTKLAEGTVVVVLRILDDCSRQLMASLACDAESTANAWACLETAMARHGRPAAFMTDSGTAFTQRRRRNPGLGEFEARLRNAGIMPILARPRHPQTCGKKEREWSTLRQWLRARPAPATLADLQRQLDAYDLIFNHQRPHQAHHGATPAQAYQAAPRASAAATPLRAPMTTATVHVRPNGVIDIGQNTQMSIGKAWAGETLTILREDPAIAIFHHDDLIEFRHLDPDRKYQLTPKRLPSPKS